MQNSRILPFPTPRSICKAGDEALLGPSPAIAQVWSQIRRVAPHFRAALLTGEPNCGAEAAARALHALSPVSRAPFRILLANEAERALSAIAPSASQWNEGLAFFPEIDRLSQEAQRRLLSKLRQRGRVLRVVGAVRGDLRAAISAGQFSADLADTLSAVRLTLPPLRERAQDIPLLANHYAQRTAERLGTHPPHLTPAFLQAAVDFAWPGNLAQFALVFDYLLSKEATQPLTADDLLAATTAAKAAPESQAPAAVRMVKLEDVVQDHIRAVLTGCHGNKLRAPEVLGISRSTLYRMLDTATALQPFPMAG